MSGAVGVMKTLNDYMAMSYRMEIVEDKDEGGQFKLRIPRSLHRSLAEHSQREGISMNQYCVYLLSRNDVIYSK